jgi:plasmid stabilization system protein ParE
MLCKESKMADEEGEIRRMAEIADAINAILEAEPSVGDTPSGSASPQAAAEAAEPQEPTQEPPSSISVENTPEETSQAEDLDAAIAAEFAADASPPPAASNPQDDPFGPAPTLDLPGEIAPQAAIGQAARAGSDMENLSLRMQDTLSEIRHQANEAWQGADDLLGEMEKARAGLVLDVREQIQAIASETQKRRQSIMQELEQLESQSLMARDEMEMMLVKFETSLVDLHKRYFHNAEAERERLARYREFLQFMLDERGV